MKMLVSLMVSRKHKMSSGNDDDDDDMSRTTNETSYRILSPNEY